MGKGAPLNKEENNTDFNRGGCYIIFWIIHLITVNQQPKKDLETFLLKQHTQWTMNNEHTQKSQGVEGRVDGSLVGLGGEAAQVSSADMVDKHTKTVNVTILFLWRQFFDNAFNNKNIYIHTYDSHNMDNSQTTTEQTITIFNKTGRGSLHLQLLFHCSQLLLRMVRLRLHHAQLLFCRSTEADLPH